MIDDCAQIEDLIFYALIGASFIVNWLRPSGTRPICSSGSMIDDLEPYFRV